MGGIRVTQTQKMAHTAAAAEASQAQKPHATASMLAHPQLLLIQLLRTGCQRYSHHHCEQSPAKWLAVWQYQQQGLQLG